MPNDELKVPPGCPMMGAGTSGEIYLDTGTEIWWISAHLWLSAHLDFRRKIIACVAAQYWRMEADKHDPEDWNNGLKYYNALDEAGSWLKWGGLA